MQIVDIELHVVNTFYQSYKQKWGGGYQEWPERCSSRFPPFLYPISSSINS